VEVHDINKQLQQYLFDYRVSVHSTTNISPASLLLNRIIRTCFDLLRPNVRNIVFKKQAELEKQSGERYRNFQVGEPTKVRN